MDIRCHSPFQPFWFRSQDASGDFHDVVVIKATYELQDERTLRIAREQEPVSVKDEYWGAPNETSVRQESDLAPFKPKADVVVIGDAYAPGGEPAESWPVQIWIDDHTHALQVHGPRRFERDGDAWRLTGSEPVARVPLRYEHAFGGAHGDQGKCEANPIGKGWLPEDADDVDALDAPQIEDADAPVESPNDERLPAGFGWTSRPWQPRLSLAGTYDEAWKSEQWPLSPHDFDDAFYNGANPALVLDRRLEGAQLSVMNMSPSGAVRFEVPRRVLDARFRYRGGRIATHETRLDTLVVDLLAQRVMATHRVRVPKVDELRVLEICMREEG